MEFPPFECLAEKCEHGVVDGDNGWDEPRCLGDLGFVFCAQSEGKANDEAKSAARLRTWKATDQSAVLFYISLEVA